MPGQSGQSGGWLRELYLAHFRTSFGVGTILIRCMYSWFYNMVMNVSTCLPCRSEPHGWIVLSINEGLVIDEADDVPYDEGEHEVLVHPQPIAVQGAAKKKKPGHL